MDAGRILAVLDDCAAAFTFPALDNGYVYPAATRLTAYRSDSNWAIVIEVFGFSPRAGLPDTHLYTFAEELHARDAPEQYVSREAYERYLSLNPHHESRFVHPIEEGPWQDEEVGELVAEGASWLRIRGLERPLPGPAEYALAGVDLADPPRIQVYELCRVLANLHREDVLADPAERRVSVAPELSEVARLEEWRHPDVTGEEMPSASETFRGLAAPAPSRPPSFPAAPTGRTARR
jgi:uncharacterized protein DUF7003